MSPTKTELVNKRIDYSDTHQAIKVFVNAGMNEKVAIALIEFVQYWYQIGQLESKQNFVDKTDIKTLEQILQKLEEVQRNQATKDDVELAKLELRKEIEEVKSEGKRVELSLQGEIKRVELSLQGEIKRVELRLEKQIEEVKLTLEKQIEEVRSEGKRIELSLQKQIEEVKLTLEKQIEDVKLTLEKQIEEVRSEGRQIELSLQKQIIESSRKTIIWVAGLIFTANAGLLTGVFLLFLRFIS